MFLFQTFLHSTTFVLRLAASLKKVLLIAIFFFTTGFLNAQDIIVLKKDESEMKCKIISVNDTLIRYNLWNSNDTSAYRIKRTEVLSFFYDEKIHANEPASEPVTATAPVAGAGAGVTAKKKKKKPEEEDAGLLEKYKSGEMVNGYVITTKKDSVSGMITVKNVALNQLEVIFTGEDKKTITYGLNDLTAYGYDKVRYQKVVTKYKGDIVNNRRSESGTLFLDMEVDGPVKLYRFFTLKFRKNTYRSNPDLPYYFGKMKNYFVISHPSGKQLSTRGRTVKGCVNSLFRDNKALMEQVRMKGVNAKTLPATVRSYNDWYLNNKK